MPNDRDASVPSRRVSMLIAIDLQNWVNDDGCFDADGVLARTQTLIERARAENVPVVYVQHEDDSLIPGETPWQLAAPLAPAEGEYLVRKRYRDSFADTTLANIVATTGATRLVITGAQSDYCVRSTAQRALSEGLDIALVSDAHTTMDAEFGGQQITAEQIIEHTNLYFSDLTFPGRTAELVTHDQVVF